MSLPDDGSDVGERPGDHTCCLHRDEKDVRRVTSRFVQRTLEDGARLLWLWDQHPPDQIEAFLRKDGIETGRHLAAGDLELRSVDRTLVPSGRFRTADALAFVRDAVEASSEQGYAGIRIVLEAGALAARLDDPGPLLRFETELEELIGELDLGLLCLYPVEEVPADVVLKAIDLHPRLLLDGKPVSAEAARSSRLTLSPIRSHAAGGAARAAEATGATGGAVGADDASPPSADSDRAPTGGDTPAAAPPAVAPPPVVQEKGLLDLLAKLEAAGEGESEDEVLRRAIAEICRHVGWPVGHVWIPNSSGEHLSSSGIWHMDDAPRFQRLTEGARAIRFRKGLGLPGKAWETGHAVRAGDLGGGRDFFQRRGQDLLGIRTGFAVPVREGDRVLAVLELSSPESGDPDAGMLRTLEYACVRLGEILGVKRMKQTLEATKRRLRALEEAAPEALVVTDEGEKIVSWSSAAAELFGSRAEEAVGKRLSTYIPDWHLKVEEALLEDYLATGEARIRGHTMELQALRRDRDAFPIELTLTSWESDGARYFGSLVRDLSQRSAASPDRLLAESARWNIREAVLVTTGIVAKGNATILYASPAFLEMTGYEGSEVLGQPIDILIGADTDPEAKKRIRRAMEDGEAVSEQVTAYRKDGSSVPIKWTAAPIHDHTGGPAPFVHIQTDLGRQRQAEEALKRAEADHLTGLANRSVFLNRAKRCIERARNRPDYRFAILFLDLNDFKEVNDRLGHVFGDEVLGAFARRLERSVRPGDTVARYGGDEFAILLDFVDDVEDVITVAERIQAEVAEPLPFDGRSVEISVSIGVALSDTGYDTPLRMVEDADAAMYRAKQEGSSCYRIYDEDLHQEALSVLRMESELLRSVRESGFALHYQPLVALSSGRILGFEALLRWKHPERGFLPAEHFISLAERTGLILSLGEWVLREACQQVQKWQQSFAFDPPLKLSVNVSATEIADVGFVDRLRDILEETGMEPGRLQLELNEKILTEEQDELGRTLAALRELGVVTCIDDFGTGRSSLALVHNVAPRTLKVDRVLVGQLGTDRDRPDSGEGEVVRAILSLARDLGMQSIAEGVETQTQLDRLLELGCEFGQGFLFSASVDAEAADLLLRGNATLTGVEQESGEALEGQ